MASITEHRQVSTTLTRIREREFGLFSLVPDVSSATFDTAVANGAGIMFKVLATQMNAWQLLVFSCML